MKKRSSSRGASRGMRIGSTQTLARRGRFRPGFALEDLPFGIDVSHHNGSVDWQATAAAGVAFAFAKSSEGRSYRDARFAENWAGMAAANVLRGAFHFFR